MSNIGTMTARITADNSRFIRAMSEVERKTQKVQQAATRMAKISGAAFLGLGASLFKAVRAYDSISRATFKMEAALRGANAEVSTGIDRALQFADALQRTTRFSDDMALSSLAMARNMGLTEQQTEALVLSSADLASAMGMDLERAVQYLGRSVVEGSNLLSRYGVVLSETEQQAFDAANAQERLAFMMQVIEGNFGGAAQSGSSAMNAFAELRHEVSNLWESFGNVVDSPIAGFFRRLSHILRTTKEATADLLGEKTELVGKIVLGAAAVAGITFVLSGLVLVVLKLIPLFKALGAIVLAIFSAKAVAVILAFSKALVVVSLILISLVFLTRRVQEAFEKWGPALAEGMATVFRWMRSQLETLATAVESFFKRFDVRGSAMRAFSVVTGVPVGLLERGMAELQDRLVGAGGLSGIIKKTTEGLGEFAEVIKGTAVGVGKEIYEEFKDILPDGLAEKVSGFFGQIFGAIPDIEMGDFGKDLRGELRELLDSLGLLGGGAVKTSEAADYLAEALARVEVAIDTPNEIEQLQRAWKELAVDLEMAGMEAGKDVSEALGRLGAYFKREIVRVQDRVGDDFRSMVAVFSGEMTASEAGIRREWARAVETLYSYADVLGLSERELEDAIQFATTHFTNQIESLSKNASNEIGHTFERVTDNFRRIELEAVRMTGQVGQLARTIQTAVQTGDPVVAGILILMDVLGRSKQFAGAMEAITDTLQVVVDSIGTMLEPALGALGYSLQVIGGIFQQLTPLFRFIGEILTMNAPILVLFGMALQAIMPLFLIIGEVLKVMAPLLELVFIAWFYQLKIVLLGILGIFIAFMFIWNGVVWAIQGILTMIAAAIGWAFRGTGEKLRELAASMDSWKADTDEAVQVFQELWDLSWSDAQQTLEDATIDIDDLGSAAQKAADSLLNVPRGFRVGRARWLAQEPVGPRDVTIPEPGYPEYKGPDLGAPFDDRDVMEQPVWWSEMPQPTWWREIPEPAWLKLPDLPGPPPSMPTPSLPSPIAPPPTLGGSSPGVDIPRVVVNIDKLESNDPKKFITEMEKLASRKSYAKTGTTVPTAPPFSMGR